MQNAGVASWCSVKGGLRRLIEVENPVKGHFPFTAVESSEAAPGVYAKRELPGMSETVVKGV